MHILQEKLLKLITERNIGNLKLREIGELIGTPHPQLIKHHINQLEKKGFIVINKMKGIVSRIDQNQDATLKAIPILGSADCGPATFFADQNVEGYLRVSNNILKTNNKLFAIKAIGQSMNKANIKGRSINNGDYVIIDSEDKEIKNGDYVISVIDEVCNIKRVHIDNQERHLALVSESTDDFPPIIIDPEEVNYLVNGKVIMVIKNPNN